ncbi:GNAT family N-acetyltransferase [Leeuwenhoekiella sp. A16]|uniref:GNAT family N-acetyltransferase n=1 Tax=Leeuwenhoekiella sp. A16 TaxID=3141462 RepID=UPI003A801C5C
MENTEIRRVSIDDLDQLQRISKQTFAETFSSGNSEANMNDYLENSFSAKKLQNELNDTNAEIYFVELDKQVIGYLKVNFGQSQTEIKDVNALEIERIYVLSEFHGKKIGQLLYEKAMQISRQRNVDYVWLGVWEENLRAIRFYEKNGFVKFDKHIFKLGDDEQTDIMMKLTLN